MKKDDLVYVRHMIDVAENIRGKVAGIDRTRFKADDNLQLALVHLIQTIGEAARRLSPEFKDAHPEVVWHQIVGMRHRIVHDYLNVDFDVVWRVATERMDPLLAELQPLVRSTEEE